MSDSTAISWTDATFNPVEKPGFDQVAYLREYRKRPENVERLREQVAAGKKRSVARSLAYLKEVKEAVPCLDCGLSYPHYVMDFDHVRGEKEGSLSDMARQGCGLAKIDQEIAKCEIVCSNCHRARTWLRLREEEAVANG